MEATWFNYRWKCNAEQTSLRENCPNIEFCLVRIQKNTNQKLEPEKIPYLDTFHAVHISKMLKDSYSHLSILKKLKRYTSQSVRKQLVESLIFSRLDYRKNLFIYLPEYQVRRKIKLQKSCASFVKGKFCSIEDVVSLKWLLVPEKIRFTVKGLLNERMPSNV